ncbi:hypothetical protein [Bosea sp. BK604]|uniref:hypothetical protein n=1 Tax=Bosea sp. BK604 TaxID=2512180 RepID=UPI001051803F|nr:hypothetical protein [Bosea sp. BK604]TCR68241.1 hypothetical protein EV560_10268 [Bosea sp. BK604]
MAHEDVVIAKALNAGLRRLLVAAFVHTRATPSDSEQVPALHEAFKREIARLVVRGKTEAGVDIELTTAVRKSLRLFVDAAYREAIDEPSAGLPLQ